MPLVFVPEIATFFLHGERSLLAGLAEGTAPAPDELLALGETFDSNRALSSGLINAIVPAAELEQAAHAAAIRLAGRRDTAVAGAAFCSLGGARLVTRSHETCASPAGRPVVPVAG